MILVDTSIWIRASGTKYPEITTHLHDLTTRDEVFGHEFVFGELLIGKAGDSRATLLTSYGDLKQLPTSLHRDVVQLVSKYGLANIGLGWVDAHLIIAAHIAEVPIWTTDGALLKAAERLKRTYEMNAVGRHD